MAAARSQGMSSQDHFKTRLKAIIPQWEAFANSLEDPIQSQRDLLVCRETREDIRSEMGEYVQFICETFPELKETNALFLHATNSLKNVGKWIGDVAGLLPLLVREVAPSIDLEEPSLLSLDKTAKLIEHPPQPSRCFSTWKGVAEYDETAVAVAVAVAAPVQPAIRKMPKLPKYSRAHQPLLEIPATPLTPTAAASPNSLSTYQTAPTLTMSIESPRADTPSPIKSPFSLSLKRPEGAVIDRRMDDAEAASTS